MKKFHYTFWALYLLLCILYKISGCIDDYHQRIEAARQEAVKQEAVQANQ